MTRVKRFVAATALALISAVAAYAEGITGIVLDKKDRQPLIGATVQVAGTGVKAITDIDGKFSLNGLKAGKYSITVNYISYKTVTLDGVEALKDTEGHGYAPGGAQKPVGGEQRIGSGDKAHAGLERG